MDLHPGEVIVFEESFHAEVDAGTSVLVWYSSKLRLPKRLRPAHSSIRLKLEPAGSNSQNASTGVRPCLIRPTISKIGKVRAV